MDGERWAHPTRRAAAPLHSSARQSRRRRVRRADRMLAWPPLAALRFLAAAAHTLGVARASVCCPIPRATCCCAPLPFWSGRAPGPPSRAAQVQMAPPFCPHSQSPGAAAALLMVVEVEVEAEVEAEAQVSAVALASNLGSARPPHRHCLQPRLQGCHQRRTRRTNVAPTRSA